MLDQTPLSKPLNHTRTDAGQATLPVVLIPGDGIGPEVARAARSVISAACPAIDWIEAEGGARIMEQGIATGLPAETLAAVEATGTVLKGPLATPVGYGGKSANVTLRKMFELYGNIRPIRMLPGIASPYAGRPIDFTIVRENVEDLYAGIEHMQTPEVAQCLKLITREGSEKIARLAFELAATEGRGKVTCATKSNIMKLTEGLFQRSFEAVAPDYPEIAAEHMIVDNCAHQMVMRPEAFEIVVMTNMNGDILSDLAAGLVGGLGLAPSANIGDGMAMFEAVHGSAPDIAGQGKANPTALILAGAMMLRHLGRPDAAARVEQAVHRAYAAGQDLPGDVARPGAAGSTAAFTDRILDALDAAPDETPAKAPAPRQAIRTAPAAGAPAPKKRTFDGVDVFVEWRGEVGPLVNTLQSACGLGAFRLSMVSNRGTVMWPNGAKHASRAPHWRCRFVAAMAPTDEAERHITELLSVIGRHLRWMHVEKLESHDGAPAYSRAQGEATPQG